MSRNERVTAAIAILRMKPKSKGPVTDSKPVGEAEARTSPPSPYNLAPISPPPLARPIPETRLGDTASVPSNVSAQPNMGDNADVIQFRIVPHLDRIDLTIPVKSGSGILERLMEISERRQVIQKTPLLIHRYFLGESRIELVMRRGPDVFSHTLRLLDPSIEVQSAVISHVLEGVAGVTLSYVEFARDCFPVNEADAEELHARINDGLVLKKGRGITHIMKKTTHYHGSSGGMPWIVRRGRKVKRPHGLCCYLLPKDVAVKTGARVELRVNRGDMWRYFLNEYDKPITPTMLDPFDFVYYREGLDVDRFTARMIMQLSKAGASRPAARFAALCRAKAIMLHSKWATTVHVPDQVTSFKKQRYCRAIRDRVDRFFPILEGKMEDVRSGRVKKNYSARTNSITAWYEAMLDSEGDGLD